MAKQETTVSQLIYNTLSQEKFDELLNDHLIEHNQFYITPNEYMGHQLGDIVSKDSLLTYENTMGYVRMGDYLYKTPVINDHYGYPDYYNRLIEEYNNATEQSFYLSSNVNIVNDCYDYDGIITNFYSSNSFAWFPVQRTPQTSFELVVKAHSNAWTYSNSDVLSAGRYSGATGIWSSNYNGILIRLTSTSATQCWMSSNRSSWDIANNFSTGIGIPVDTDFLFKVEWDGTTYKFSYSLDDGATWNYGNSITSSLRVAWDLQCLGGCNGEATPLYGGTIDLSQCYLNIDGERVWTGTNKITFKTSGDKLFYNINDRQNVIEYIKKHPEFKAFGIDTENERILLPDDNSRVLVKQKIPEFSGTSLDKSWYKLYSDGWIEQGGQFTTVNANWVERAINFPIPYKDTSYVILEQTGYTSNTDQGCVYTKYNTMVRMAGIYNSTGNANWYSCGFTNEITPQTSYKYMCVGNCYRDTAYIDLVTQVGNSIQEISDAADDIEETITERLQTQFDYRVREMGEMVSSSIPLNEASLHLLDGSTLDKNGIYKDFVSYMYSLYLTGSDLFLTDFDYEDVKVGGNAYKASDGYYYFPDNQSYLTIGRTFAPVLNDTWEIVTKIKTPVAWEISQGQFIGGETTGKDYDGFIWRILTDGIMSIYMTSNGSSWDIASNARGNFTYQLNTEYYIRLQFTGTNYIVSHSTDGENWSQDWSVATTAVIKRVGVDTIIGSLRHVAGDSGEWNKGGIKLEDSYIKINGEYWWQGKTHLTAEEYYAKMINDYGVCNHYVFKDNGDLIIPKTYNSERSLIACKKPEGFNSTWYNLYSDGWCEQSGFLSNYADVYNTVELPIPYMDDNYFITQTYGYRGSYTSTVQGSHIAASVCKVNPRGFNIRTFNDGMGANRRWYTCGYTNFPRKENNSYNYVCVATSIKHDYEIDIDNIAEDLENKANKDLSNVSSNVDYVVERFHNGTEWYRLYKSGWCEQGGITPQASGNQTVRLLKPYIDTQYFVQLTVFGGTSSDQNWNVVSLATDSFVMYDTENFRHMWEAKGYIR